MKNSDDGSKKVILCPSCSALMVINEGAAAVNCENCGQGIYVAAVRFVETKYPTILSLIVRSFSRANVSDKGKIWSAWWDLLKYTGWPVNDILWILILAERLEAEKAKTDAS